MTCEREDWCDEPATRTYTRTDWQHYHPGDDRTDVPFEIVHTCDRHPMGDGQGAVWVLDPLGPRSGHSGQGSDPGTNGPDGGLNDREDDA